MQTLGVSALCACSLHLFAAPHPAAGSSLVLIHALANEGRSAGGHIALQLDEDVYHFQVRGDRVLRLDRESWRAFRARYSSLENRALEFARIEVEERDLARVRRHLDRLRVVQRSQLEALELAVFEREWAEASMVAASSGRLSASVEVEGAGLFDHEAEGAPTADAKRLRDVIATAHGAEFPARELRRIEGELARDWQASDPPALDRWSTEHLSPAGTTSAELLLESLWLREAFSALANASPLRREHLLDPLGDQGWILTAAERRWLREARDELESRTVALFAGRRPDRGRALLIAIARHRAFSQSLRDGRFWTLDPLPANARIVSSTEGRSREHVIRSLAEDAEARHRGLRRLLQREDRGDGEVAEWSEAFQLELEIAAARHRELRLASEHGRPIRLLEPPVLPLPSAQLKVPLLGGDALAVSKRSEDRIREALDRLHGYSLFERNCATELARSLVDAFPDASQAEVALGGSLAPSASSFFPVALFHRARRDLRTSAGWTLPSYRIRRLEELAGDENAWLLRLRESNTLSSEIYTPSSSDSAFLLFTDESVWSRPLFGATNLLYGVVQAGAGLVSWPVDQGGRLRRGLRGALYSLPELAFINIRKGHFDYNEEISSWLSSDDR